MIIGMKVTGRVFSGVMRGRSLIGIYFYRLIGLIGYEPYKGTMDLKLDRQVDVKAFSLRSIDHFLLDGTKSVEAYLAPVRLHMKGQTYDCWAMQQVGGVYEHDTIEIIAKDSIKERFQVADGDEIEIEFFDTGKKEEKKGSVLEKLVKKTGAALRTRRGR